MLFVFVYVLYHIFYLYICKLLGMISRELCKFQSLPKCCQFCDKPEKTIIEKLHPTNHKQIGGFSFNTETQVIRPIQLTWKQHRIDKVKVPYPSQWQYLKSNPSKLVFVGDPKIQLGLVDTNEQARELRRWH